MSKPDSQQITNRKRIKDAAEAHMSTVYKEMRTYHHYVFRDVIQRSEAIALNNKVELAVAAEYEKAMMLLAYDTIRRK